MKKILLIYILAFFSLAVYSQTGNSNKKISNYHQKLTFNTIGYNDYDLGTSSTMSYSNSIVKVDVDNDGTGTLITYINDEKTLYFINQCERETNNGSFLFELLDKEDMKTNRTIISVEADLIVSNNTIQAFKIFIKGKNEAIILMNR